MKRSLFIVGIFLAGVARAADWVYDSGVVYDENWSFTATVSGTNISIGKYQNYPDTVQPLDFSKPVKSLDGSVTYTIVKLDPQFANYAARVGDAGTFIGKITMPGEGLTELGGYTFAYCTSACGDIVLPDSLEKMPKGTFLGTKITSVVFGKSSITLDPNWQPHFSSCSLLTNVVFKAGGQNKITTFQIFAGCSSLKELDLSGVISITNTTAGTGSVYYHLNNCNSLTNIIFGAELQTLGAAFLHGNGNGKLERVEFLGAPPANLALPLFNELRTTQKVLIVIPESKKTEWAPYVVDPTFKNEATQIKAEFLRSGTDPSSRPVRTTAWKPKEMSGWVFANGKISYGGWTFNATAVATNITIKTCTSDPGPGATLDFSLPIQDLDNDYVITSLEMDLRNYANKTNLVTLVLPKTGRIAISGATFKDCSNLTGDLDLSAVVSIGASGFQNTGITSVKFGPNLQWMEASWESGSFQGCTSLKKVVFDPRSSASIVPVNKVGFTFADCTSLEYADLSGVTLLHCDNYYRPIFRGCKKLSTLVLSNLTGLATYVFYGDNTPVNLHFYGAAPTLTQDNKVDLGKLGGITYVHLDPKSSSYKTDLASWNAMTEEGKIGVGTIWKKSLLVSASDNRPLILVDHMDTPVPGAYFKATWNEGTKTLKFYYDDQDYSQAAGVTTQFLAQADIASVKSEVELAVFDASFRNYTMASCVGLFNGFSKLASIENLDYLKTDASSSFKDMFNGCVALKELDLARFGTRLANNMEYMFADLPVSTLDISSFNTTNVTNMSRMFSGASKLQKIWVSEKFTTWKTTYSSNMFADCTDLVGGKGTTYNSTKVDKTYARIDGGLEAPGYLRCKYPPGLMIVIR